MTLLHFRKPSLLVHIRDESPGLASNDPGEEMTAGEINELIMQSLLEQGRLRLDQLTNSVAHKLDKPVDQIRELLQRHFFGLVKVRHAQIAATRSPARLVPAAVKLLQHAVSSCSKCIA